MLRSILVPLLMVATASLAQESKDLTGLLRQKDQALANAIAPGDEKVWEAALSADFFYADENNKLMNRAEFLNEFRPLPKGASGDIVITHYELRRAGATAIVAYGEDETEHYFGSELHAQYLLTVVWQEFGGQWKLRSVHCAAVPVDPLAVTLTDAQMNELTGTFHAGALTYRIRFENHRLLGGQPGHKESELEAETRDVLFIAGQPRSRKVFFRISSGSVTGFADRRENRDLKWEREK
jgi:hypothetical protein